MLSYNHSKGNRAESTGQEVTEMEKLVEATAKDAQDAARIIREAIPKQ